MASYLFETIIPGPAIMLRYRREDVFVVAAPAATAPRSIPNYQAWNQAPRAPRKT